MNTEYPVDNDPEGLIIWQNVFSEFDIELLENGQYDRAYLRRMVGYIYNMLGKDNFMELVKDGK